MEVALVVAGDQDQVKMGQRMAALAVEDTDEDGLVVEVGEGLIGAGQGRGQQGEPGGESERTDHAMNPGECIGGEVEFPSFDFDFPRAGGAACRCRPRHVTLKGRMDSPLVQGLWTGLGAVAGLGLAAGGYAYAAMWPGSQLFGPTLIAPRRPGELALTFDDGPNPAWTPRLLDLLAGHDVRATFFMVGSHAQAEPALVRRVAEAGHLIGNHSWSHPNLAVTAAGRVEEELARTSRTLEEITGAPIRYFRPPFGARRPLALRAARRLGMVPVLWTAMTSDWSEPSVDRIVARLTSRIDRLERRGRAGNIVLHDGNHLDSAANRGPSVAAAGQLLGRYEGSHRFVTLDAWAPATG